MYPPASGRRVGPAIVALAAIILVAVACGAPPPEPFRGTELTSGAEATPFELQDHQGRAVALSDFDGDVVVLTFLYTGCPDVCPITTAQLLQAHERLGESADDVAIVAVSVDPSRDTVEAAHSFSERWGMTDKWSFLVGEEAQLRPIWSAYYIDPAGVADSHSDHDDHDHEATTVSEDSDATRPQEEDAAGADYLVIHSAPVYLIDRDGIMRAVFTLPFETDDLVHDVRLLAD